MRFLSDNILSTWEFVEAYTGRFYPMYYYDEAKQVLDKYHISLNKGYKITDIPKLAKTDSSYVIVGFGMDDFRVMLVPKNHVKSFEQYLSTFKDQLERG